jgi:hypothetical protein
MSKSDIQSWISSSGARVDEDGVQQENIWQRDRVPTDWPIAMEHGQMVLLNGKTKARIEFLRSDLSGLVKHAGQYISTLLNLLVILTDEKHACRPYFVTDNGYIQAFDAYIP